MLARPRGCFASVALGNPRERSSFALCTSDVVPDSSETNPKIVQTRIGSTLRQSGNLLLIYDTAADARPPRCGCGLRCKMDAPSVSWRSIRSNRRRPKPIRELERIFESSGVVEVGTGSIPRDPTHEYRVNPKLLEWVQRLDPTYLR
jgi:hypothetical protein